ncbi:MAG TPA: exo-beta-N-acetylmuramidase NamZ domain-containing protein, partial [Pyrinomonadaceae bacterium]|nr:exo-beta-N-acetylmuramidase NamZ domain-containing protein [Pyrinomonadaceae bacterium]
LAYAHEESDRLQHRHIGTEHLLLGLLREDRSMAAEILYERGLRLNAVRDEIARRSVETELEGRAELQQPPEAALWIDEIRSYGQGLMAMANRLIRFYGGKESMTEAVFEDALTKGESPSKEPGQEEGERMHRGGTVRKTGRRTVLGLEKLLEDRIELVRGARVGLVCNQASVDHSLRHAADLFHERSELRLTTLFGPQHGIRGDVQDNMIETEHMTDRRTGRPIYSLYSETREPTEQMLEDVDVLVFDMQDVGCRIYTFIYTLANCMRAAKKYSRRVIVCDRPNPITGVHLGGNVLEAEYASFVGQFPIPTRHGMTVGELGRMFNEHFGIGCELEVVTMEGWGREQWMDETDAPWVMPSPNMPTLLTATVFPGTVHVEGTQLSEGRGTTRPFELIGAPYIEAEEYAARLMSLGLAGTYYRPSGFQPTFQKHAGRTCGGVQIHVTDREAFEPVLAGVATVKVAYDLYEEHFRWKEPPYEYVFDKNPFDVIAGTKTLREQIERHDSLETIHASWARGAADFKAERERYLLY